MPPSAGDRRRSPRLSCPRGNEGSATLEIAILAPGMLLLLGLLIGIGRTQQAHQAVEAAARDAARQASISRNPAAAQQAATTSAQAALSREGLHCNPTVAVDTGPLNRKVGTQATVTATVSCEVSLAGVLVPGVPGSVHVSAHFSSPVDPYRGAG